MHLIHLQWLQCVPCVVVQAMFTSDIRYGYVVHGWGNEIYFTFKFQIN